MVCKKCSGLHHISIFLWDVISFSLFQLFQIINTKILSISAKQTPLLQHFSRRNTYWVKEMYTMYSVRFISHWYTILMDWCIYISADSITSSTSLPLHAGMLTTESGTLKTPFTHHGLLGNIYNIMWYFLNILFSL